MASLNLVLGDMLHDGLPGLDPGAPVFMAEDAGLCTHFRYHQQKLVLFLSAMRHFRDRLDGREVLYHELGETPYLDRLDAAIRARGITRITTYEVNDRFFRDQLGTACRDRGVELVQIPSPMFLTDAPTWKRYRAAHPRLFMADFYRFQRRRLGLLLDAGGGPVGGKWSFDVENRRRLPARLGVPDPWFPLPDRLTEVVIERVESRFGDHPGCAADFRYPVTHEAAAQWLDDFVETRLDQFGDYEDALSQTHRVVFHGLLTPLLNTGLLNPRQVVEEVMARHRRSPVPLNSLEGFIRQVIGWREFMRGIEREYERTEREFTGGGDRQLRACWYDGTTGLPPLDAVICRARDHAYAHHIERLMVAGAAMLMADVAPSAAYGWFMEMFIDSADWVMRPNVFGMSQFADGGLFATKPYVSGSAYLLRMGDWPRGPWCDVWDGLFWRFIANHRDEVAANPRMAMMVRSFDRLDAGKRSRLIRAAEAFIERTTEPAG